MPITDIYQVIENISSIPTLPELLLRASLAIDDPDVSASDMNRLLSRDMALGLRVLKEANSMKYGQHRKIESLADAQGLIGYDNLRSLIITTPVFDMASAQELKKCGFYRDQLWEHSFGVAIAASVIGKVLKCSNVTGLFSGGLFHDVGKLFLDSYFPDYFIKILKKIKQMKCLMHEAEKDVIGITHTEIADLLLDKWNFPKSLKNMIVGHHFEKELPAPILKCQEAAIIHLADILVRSKCIGSGGDRSIPPVSTKAWKLLGFSDDDLESIMSKIDKEYIRYTRLLIG